MATKYTYTISTDFPNEKVDASRLTKEIQDSSITTVLNYITYNNSADKCDVWFDTDLSTEDKTILDTVVANHSGEPLPPPVEFGSNYIIVEDASTTMTTATEFQQKLRLDATDLKAGIYRIGYSYECMGSNQGQFMARVQIDDTTVIYEVDEELRPSLGWRPCSGFGKIALSEGNHFIDLDYCTTQSNGVSRIRRARLELMGIGE